MLQLILEPRIESMRAYDYKYVKGNSRFYRVYLNYSYILNLALLSRSLKQNLGSTNETSTKLGTTSKDEVEL